MEINPHFDIFEAPLHGVHLVEASAGTGKTWNIEAIVVRLLSEVRPASGKRLKPRDVLVVTFTEAATQELRERIINRINQVYQALRELSPDLTDPFLAGCVQRYGLDTDLRMEILEHLDECKQEFDEASIFTIHGFASTVLKDFRFETGIDFNVEIQKDTKVLIDELIGDFWRRKNVELSKIRNNRLRGAITSWFKKDTLASQLTLFTQQPKTQIILPDTPDQWVGKSMIECYHDLNQLLEAVEEVWIKEREVIRGELASIKVSRFDYAANFEKWEEKLLQFIQNPFSNVKVTDLDRFTPDFFELKRASAIPQHRVFQMIQDVAPLFTWLGQTEIRQTLISLRDGYRASRKEKKVLIYEDLLTILSDALEQSDDPVKAASLRNKLRDRYKVALIDEFQDTDPIQFNIFQKIYVENVHDSDRLLYLIGDPKQAIYKFRGADLNTYLEVRDKVDSQFSLAVNYRSSENMVDGVNRFFGKNHAFINPKLRYRPVSANQSENPLITDVDNGNQALRFVQIGNEEITNKTLASNYTIKWVGSQIAALLNSSAIGNSYFLGKNGTKRAISPGDIAILVSSKRQANIFREHLASINVPSVETGDTNIFDSRDAYLLSLLLECMLNPGATRKVRALLSTEYFRKNIDEINEWQTDNLRWSDLIQSLNVSRTKAENEGILPGLRYFFDLYDIELTLLKSQFGERRLTNLRHLTELLYSEEKESHRNFSSLLNWLKRKRLSDSFSDDVFKMRLESDAERVQVITMHSSKGLEYPIVFAPFLWETVKKTIRNKCYTFRDDSGTTIMEIEPYLSSTGLDKHFMEAWEDRIRLAYVTLTRSRYRCYIPFPLHKEGVKSPLFGTQLGSNTHIDYLGFGKNSKYPDYTGNVFTQENILSFMLKKEVEINQDVIQYSIATKRSVVYTGRIEENIDCQPRIFNSKHRVRLIPERNISSYSSIQRKYDAATVLYDGILDEVDLVESSASTSDNIINIENEQTEINIFNFPKGADTGNLWHEIFELIDFSDTANHEVIIQSCCEKHGYDYELFGNVLKKMVNLTLQKNLLESKTLRLKDLTVDSTLREMEFLLNYDASKMEEFLKALGFDSSNLDTDDIFAQTNIEVGQSDEPGNPSKISYLLTGLIDLVFEHQGKFYILDYKSNYLGESTDKYSPDTLKHDIWVNKYNMQYHIYCVALNKYLSKRMYKYSYDTHFGGVFYLYLRGINVENRSGIFFDRPDLGLLKKLSDLEGTE
jgi:exodeoxyribonuclease V beta subunit